MKFKVNREQRNALDGLAYWIADINYIKERFGVDDPEYKQANDTITKDCFPILDKLHVPFWVQNAVICFAENWRQYKSCYMWDYLKARNINIA